ncbi:hypothetical protein PIB30_039780 [Stylosanthes scabra]|uniref:RING-type domain-containing protein n=1 Tax=Stylosanthes scabra TaxID=79078 RepID=A0ABU6WCJ4_9FABA|nr:hypothetical protein [Stylosanthes scabra]
MGLSNYPCAAEGVIPLIVMNTVMSVALLKNMFRSVLQAVGATTSSSSSSSSTTNTYSYYPSSYTSLFQDTTTCASSSTTSTRPRRVSITHYKSLCSKKKSVMVECCVCLTRFEANQEVSELPCKHFFHTTCLDKWFDNRHPTCPLCRSFS